MLIVFEGIDGSGKNTQIGKLLQFFRQNKICCRLHKYPTKKAKAVFAHLKGKKDVRAEKLADVFADDIMMEQAKLKRELSSGFVVICDRYLHSTLAYQGAKIGYGKVRGMLEPKHALSPDLVLLLDIDAEEGAKRKACHKKPDRFEKDVKYLGEVRKNYLREAKESFLCYRFAVVDGSRPSEEVFSEVVMYVEPLLTRKMK